MCGTEDPSLGPAGKLVDFFPLPPADKKALSSFSQGVEREHTWGWGAIAAPATGGDRLRCTEEKDHSALTLRAPFPGDADRLVTSDRFCASCRVAIVKHLDQLAELQFRVQSSEFRVQRQGYGEGA